MQFENWYRCSSQRQKSIKQFIRQLAACMSELSQQNTSSKESMHYLWQTTKRVWVLRKALSEIQKIWESTCSETKPIQQSGRIRRLTPTEVSRLQTIPEWYKWKQLFKTYYIWQQNAELKIARETSLVRNQDCVTYTTYDLSELEQHALEKQLINLKNALLMDVTESVQPMQGFALCTTSVLPEQDPPNYWKEKASIKNFVLYVEYISKGDADQQKDCAPSITEALLCMGMNVKLIEEMNQ